MEMKICSKCFKTKDLMRDFYMCKGIYRSECKMCTIQNNNAYQKENKGKCDRYWTIRERREYYRDYYQKNKEKFAQYRAEFKERNPDYYKVYHKEKKKKDQE